MIDPAFFTSGSLFTTDYLVEAITGTPAYVAVDVVALRARLAQMSYFALNAAIGNRWDETK